MPNEEDLLDLEEDEVAEEPVEEEEVEDGSEEDELDYQEDEDGNIIIPDDDEDETPPKEEKKDEPNEEISALRKKYAELEAQAKDTLKRLGVKDMDALRGLAKLAADEDGSSVDEYLAKRAKEVEAEEAVNFMRKQKFEQKAALDLTELKAAYAGLDDVKSILDLPNAQRFMELRDQGLTVKEAYAAANPDGVRNTAAESARKKALEDTKAHLKTVVPKMSKDSGVKMTRQERDAWRELFPGKSDKEIIKLYRDTL